MSANQTTAIRPAARDGIPFWACNRAIAAVVESILRIASRAFRRPDPVWFGLNDQLLADIGKTRGRSRSGAPRLADASWDNGRPLDLAGLDQAAAPVQLIRLRRRGEEAD